MDIDACPQRRVSTATGHADARDDAGESPEQVREMDDQVLPRPGDAAVMGDDNLHHRRRECVESLESRFERIDVPTPKRGFIRSHQITSRFHVGLRGYGIVESLLAQQSSSDAGQSGVSTSWRIPLHIVHEGIQSFELLSEINECRENA